MEFKINNRLKRLNGILCEVDSIYQTLLAAKNVSDSEFVVIIAILSLGEGCLQKDIAENSYMSKKTINSAIKKLEKEEYIELKAGKYPNMHIYFTEKGFGYVKNKILPIIEVENKVLNDIPEEEFEHLIKGYTKYITSFKEHVAKYVKNEK